MGVLEELFTARSADAARPYAPATATVIPVSEVVRAQNALRELPYKEAVTQRRK
jgi:hypothetical protein